MSAYRCSELVNLSPHLDLLQNHQQYCSPHLSPSEEIDFPGLSQVLNSLKAIAPSDDQVMAPSDVVLTVRFIYESISPSDAQNEEHLPGDECFVS